MKQVCRCYLDLAWNWRAKLKKQVEKIEVNQPLLNMITPMGLDFKASSLQLGEYTARVYGSVKYPPAVDMGWLVKITNAEGAIVDIAFYPADSTELVEAISRNIALSRGMAESTRDPLTRSRAERGAQDGERIMRQIDAEGETVGYITIMAMPMAKEKDVFSRVCRRTESIFSAARCKIRALPNLQKQALRSISPYHVPDETTKQILGRMMPMSTLWGGFPFSSSGINDGCGAYFAKDDSNGLVILDPWKRGGDRTNTNFVVTGVPGVGKSTVVKHLMLSEYARGTKIIVVDAEREYKDLCFNLNGDWLNCGGGAGGRNNPLEIRCAPKDDDPNEKEDEALPDEGENGMGNLALHMKTLEVFFQLYIPSLTDIQRALLMEMLEELYKNFGIEWETDISEFNSTDYPIFSDLHKLIMEKSKEENENSKEFKTLASLIRNIAVGSDSFVWNGHSTIAANTKFICLDTHDLQEMSDRIKRTQYFNLLGWVWHQMSRNRDERVLFVADEAHLMVDPNVPQSLVFLQRVAKRARKYGSGIAIISHSVVDFLHESIKMYGQALLDLPCYKILMGTDGKNLQEMTKLFSLTEAEQELLLSKRRGHSLFMAGSRRMHAHFDLPQYKLDYMGRGGGK